MTRMPMRQSLLKLLAVEPAVVSFLFVVVAVVFFFFYNYYVYFCLFLIGSVQ